MKKNYVEPQMIVEDFTVSEMVAKNCGIIESEIKITTQASTQGCDGGFEDPVKDQAYNAFSELFDEDPHPLLDSNNDGDFFNDTCFTEAIRHKADNISGFRQDVCAYIPTETFNDNIQGFKCTADSGLVQNS